MLTKQENYFSVERISLLAILTALTTVGRLTFSLPFLPNIQPMTAFLLIITLNVGVIDGLVVSLLSVLLTNLFLGMGPWTVMQIMSFAIVILLTAILKKFYSFGSYKTRTFFSVWGLITGFLYGLIISYLNFQFYGLTNFIVYYLNGLPFDLLHGFGNMGFFFILEPIIVPIIDKKFNKVLNHW